MSFRVPVSTQEPLAVKPHVWPYAKRATLTVPNAGGTGSLIVNVPVGYRTRLLCVQAFVQYDSGADNQQYVTWGMDANTSYGLQNVYNVYEFGYAAPTQLWRYSAFPGADTNFRDIITSAGVTTRSITRCAPAWWLPEGSRIYLGYHNFNANDDGVFNIFYEEERVDV